MRHNILDNSENRANEVLQTNGSSGHDPLCPYVVDTDGVDYSWNDCQCDLIAKVRSDTLAKFTDSLLPFEWVGNEADLRNYRYGYQQAIRDAAGETALVLLAMDGVELTPEQHNSVVEAILALQEKP